jgi:hypothetical protein
MAGALALRFANRSGVVYGQSFARLQHRETGHLACEVTPFGGCARWRDLGTVPPNKSGHRLGTTPRRTWAPRGLGGGWKTNSPKLGH